jgi:hypothetical protein
MVLGAFPSYGHGTFQQRLTERVSEHLPMLTGLAVLIFASYFVYRQFYPDTYECRLTDGKTVTTEVGEDTIPVSRVKECKPLVVTISQRIARAFETKEND